MKDVLYFLGLKKNILSISALYAKGMSVPFIYGQVLIFWTKGKTIDDATMNGEQDEGLYKLEGHPERALVHQSIEPT